MLIFLAYLNQSLNKSSISLWGKARWIIQYIVLGWLVSQKKASLQVSSFKIRIKSKWIKMKTEKELGKSVVG